MGLTLTTLAEIRDFTGITSSQIADPLLERIARSAERSIFSKTNRPSGFLTASYTELINGRGKNYLYAVYSPITAISSISIVHTASSSTTISSTLYGFETGYSGKIYAYTVDKEVGSFETGAPLTRAYVPSPLFPNGVTRKNISVSYTGGYATIDDVPEDLSQAVIELTGLYAARRKRDLALQSETLGNYSYQMAARMELDSQTGYPDPIAALVRPYIRMVTS